MFFHTQAGPRFFAIPNDRGMVAEDKMGQHIPAAAEDMPDNKPDANASVAFGHDEIATPQ